MVNWNSLKLRDTLVFINLLLLLILINIVSQFFFLRIDLTEEKRYSLKNTTKAYIQELQEPVFIEVYLTGELNPAFTRLKKSIEEIGEEFRLASNNTITIHFTDPSQAKGEKARNEFMADLAARGVQPRNIIETVNGKRQEKIVFPGAIVSASGLETGVNFLKGNAAAGSEEVINQSIEGLEYELLSAIQQLTNVDRSVVGIVSHNVAYDSLEIYSFTKELSQRFDLTRVDLNQPLSPQTVQVAAIVKPNRPFTEKQKFHLDQYIMQGGSVLFLLDKLDANMDSTSHENYFAFPVNTNLDDQLFRYGLRINPDLVYDKVASLYPVVTGVSNNQPQMQLLDWPFYPLINQYSKHEVTKNLDAVVLKFANTIDTVKAPQVKKTPLLFSSIFSKSYQAPVKVSVNDIRKDKEIPQRDVPFTLGYMLEGSFTSLYKNRFLPEGVEGVQGINQSKPTRLLVIADGDIALNVVNPRTRQPQQMGFDPYSNYTFANKDLLMNAMSWLSKQESMLVARNKEVKIRPLNKNKINEEKQFWQFVNIVVPIACVLVLAVLLFWLRKKQFANFHG
ncbi:MAG: gliding motility-associated ABC transporter substrate-binding protein GldG [Chryseotalea sp.]